MTQVRCRSLAPGFFPLKEFFLPLLLGDQTLGFVKHLKTELKMILCEYCHLTTIQCELNSGHFDQVSDISDLHLFKIDGDVFLHSDHLSSLSQMCQNASCLPSLRDRNLESSVLMCQLCWAGP